MKKINILLFGLVLSLTACADLDQSPENIASSDSLTDFIGVLNAAYNYQTGSATPLAVMGDYRADNIVFDESPHTSFQAFDGTVIQMDGDFFTPFYVALYKSILSANNVIENSDNAVQIAEAQFLRGLSYFKLVKVFGAVTVNLSDSPSITDTSILVRVAASEVYTSVIIPDLKAAIAGLDNSGVPTGRASKIAAQGILGKAYIQIGNFTDAAIHLGDVVSGAAAAGIELEDDFGSIFADDLSKEVIFATQISSSITISDYSGTTFPGWYSGGDTKGDEEPITPSLIAAFDASEAGGDTDARRAASIDESNAANVVGSKYSNRADEEIANADWIELRLADAILLYAEALNENGGTAAAVTELNKIRTRAGLTASSQTDKDAARIEIANERRLELALEGQRWFDLVRTDATGQDAGYDVFPIPTSEISSSNKVITQNSAY